MGTVGLFSIDLSKEEKGLLWALWEVFRRKETGRLTIKTHSSSRSDLTKEIWFLAGEPMAIKSNWSQDSLRYFGVHHAEESEKNLAKLWSELDSLVNIDFFAQEVLKRGVMNPLELQSFLQRFFRERLFNALNLRRGSVSFVPEEAAGIASEVVRLEKPFEIELWKQILIRFDAPYCKSLFAKFSGKEFLIDCDFPLSLDPKELRVWNQMRSKNLSVNSLDGLALQLLMVAHEFNLVNWGGGSFTKLESDLESLIKKFEKANAFEVLSVNEQTSDAEVKAKYLEYIKKYHPDRIAPNLPDQIRSLAEQIMSQVNEAFSILSDSSKKQELLDQIELERRGGIEGITQRLKAESAFDEARRLLSKKSYPAALKILEGPCAPLAADLDYQVELSFAQYMMQKNTKLDSSSLRLKLNQLLDQIIRERSDYVSAYYYKALLYKLDSQTEKALEYFDEVLRKNPQHQDAAAEARLLRMRKTNETPEKKSWFRKKT